MWALNEGLLLTFCLFSVLAYFDAHLLKMQQTYISNFTATALLSHIVAASLKLSQFMNNMWEYPLDPCVQYVFLPLLFAEATLKSLHEHFHFHCC